MANRILLTLFIWMACLSTRAASATYDSNAPIPLLRLKLVLDAFNSDDIAIGFLSTATTQYNSQLDSKYFPGINPAEGLSSLSSDNVPLAVNILPLPKQNALVIRLDVEAANSGPFTLERTQLDSIPRVYDLWLMDKYTKDSLNLRTNTSYAFNINKNDTASFGSSRFTVVIRQNSALSMHLLSFDAVKAANGNQISWTTENEQDNTAFTVERSIDGGATFFGIDSLTSNGSGAYSYDDKTPIDGTDTYRLKTQDMNGLISYSNAVSAGTDNIITTENRDNTISIYPNPSSGLINLDIKPNNNNNVTPGSPAIQAGGSFRSVAAMPVNSPSSYAIKIISIKGLVVKSSTSSSTNWQDNLGSLPPGTYIVQVINNGDKSLVGKSTFVKL